MQNTYDEAVSYIMSKIGFFRAETGVIIGTGLCDNLKYEILYTIDYKDIPNFVQPNAPTHKGKLIFAHMGKQNVIIMMGRFHYYEGYSMEEITYPIHVLHKLGVRRLILTNAVGAVNSNYKLGDIVVIKDHIYFSTSPLRNEFKRQRTFPNMQKVYTEKLTNTVLQKASVEKIPIHLGNYFYMEGPQFETPAEINAISVLGGDVVGMSTIPEIIVAASYEMEVLCLSMISNYAAKKTGPQIDTLEVIATCRSYSKRIESIITHVLSLVE